ncbi:immunoglobulin-like domain-containing protein [Pseudoclavibacter sp. CFCC 13611]|uniref:immunoglobulin-like domain-containing protein n=1 Tax=Pseudoclavibacter sp. CFCC 13611 TaxID=2615178 RepID=UPI001787D825|nr:immunoglobulin-like domain-containing protein [Pseudoclavibacter sp. CFCC 13611]
MTAVNHVGSVSNRRGRSFLRRAGAGTLGLALAASGALIAPLQASAADEASQITPVTRDIAITSEKTQSIPGQYQIAYSSSQDALYVTGSVGRPPIVTSTIAKLDPKTLKVEALAELPTIARDETKDGVVSHAGVKRLGAYGIDVDDANGQVWVTNTRDNQVSSFDLNTLGKVWSSYEENSTVRDQDEVVTTTDNTGATKSTTYKAGTTKVEQELSHPREVIVDEKRGFVYVSAAARGGDNSHGVQVYDAKTHEQVKSIETGEGTVTMGFALDEANGKLYTSDMSLNKIYEIDLEKQEISKRIDLQTKTDGKTFSSSNVAIDAKLGEVYTANQGGGALALQAYDINTGALKYEVNTGNSALAVAVDQEKHLIYAADFKDGTVSVVDGLSHGVINTVKIADKSANHLVVADGSAFVVDKAGRNQNATIPYALDILTGKSITANTEVKGSTADPTPVNADDITKITPGKSTARAYVQNTKQIIPGDSEQPLVVSGSGFSPNQRLAVKIDRDAYGQIAADDDENVPNATRGRILTDANGNFTNEKITVPAKTSAGVPTTAGDHTLFLLDNDPVTSVQAPFQTTAAKTSSEPAPSTVTSSEVTVTSSTEVLAGTGKIRLSGTGWVGPTAGVGSIIGIKLDEGNVVTTQEVKHPQTGAVQPNKTIYGIVMADAAGEWSTELAVPTLENSNQEWKAGTTHKVRLLTGSLLAGDKMRSVESADVKVVSEFSGSAIDPTPADVTPQAFQPATSVPTTIPFQGYPESLTGGPDVTAPELTVPADQTVNVGDAFDPKAGVSAKDNVDGDLTDKVVVEGTVDTSKVGEYTLTYSVKDAAGNETKKSVTVTVADKTAPELTVPADQTVNVGDAFDPKAGVSAKDNVDGDLTDKVVAEGTVDTSKVGEYTLTYSVKDAAGNEMKKSVTVTVEVIPPTATYAHSDDLTDQNRGGVSLVSLNGTVATLKVEAPNVQEGESLYVYGYSTPQGLGWAKLTDGQIAIDVAKLGVGDHKLAVQKADGDFLGWAGITVPETDENQGATPGQNDSGEQAPVKPGQDGKDATGTQNSGTLAHTGAGVAGVLGGVALLIVGAGALLAVRRRRA